jgi:hypothetical protein
MPMVPSFDAPCRWQWMNLVVVLNFDEWKAQILFLANHGCQAIAQERDKVIGDFRDQRVA